MSISPKRLYPLVVKGSQTFLNGLNGYPQVSLHFALFIHHSHLVDQRHVVEEVRQVDKSPVLSIQVAQAEIHLPIILNQGNLS